MDQAFSDIKIGNAYYGVARLESQIDIIKPTDSLISSASTYIPAIASIIETPDLTWFSSVLTSNKPNKNNDWLDTEDLIRNYKTAVNKRIAHEHEDTIIGHITESYLANTKLEKVDEEGFREAAKKDKVYVITAGVIYNLQFTDEAEDVMDAAAKMNRKGVSWELIFPEAEFHIGSKVVKAGDNEYKSIFDRFKEPGGRSTADGKPIIRHIINSIITGEGFVRNPAGQDSRILSAGTHGVFCDAKSGCVNIFDMKDQEASEKAEAQEKNMGAGSKPNFEAIAFEVDSLDSREILTEIFDEAVAEGLNNSSEINAGSRPARKKKGRRSAPKGYSKSSEDYGDPTNYEFPIDTKERVGNSLNNFFQKPNVSEYSSAEKLFILRRIIDKASKLGIEISEDILSQAHMGEGKYMTKDEMMMDEKKRKEMMEEEKKKKESGKADEVPGGQPCGCSGKSGATVVPQNVTVVNNPNPSNVGGKETGMAELDEMKAKLEVASATTKDLGDKLKIAEASIKELSDKAKAAEDALKVAETRAKTAEDALASRDLDAKTSKRMVELAEAGVSAEGDAKAKQEKFVRGMDDESFATYKESLTSVKAKAKPAEDPAKVAEAAKAAEVAAAEAAKSEKVAPADLSQGKTELASANASVAEGSSNLRDKFRKLG